MKSKRQLEDAVVRAAMRTAVADYMSSEGCSCCEGLLHDEHKARLAKLLRVVPYADGSGYDFPRYCGAALKAARRRKRG